MLINQRPVKQKFNTVANIANFNKKGDIQVDAFTRKKNFEKPSVDSQRGNIFHNDKNNKNKLKPTLYVNNSTRKSTYADLANVRPSFKKSNPVKYYSDFTIISALENASRNGKYHFDVNSINLLKDYVKNYDPSTDPDKTIDNIPENNEDIPKVVEYTPTDTPIPNIPIQLPDTETDTPIIPVPS